MSLADHELEYACFGPPPGEAPTLVLLHEGLGCVGLWRDWPEALVAATGMGVLAYSRAGYGQSSPVSLPRPLDYMTREATDVLGPVMDALGVGPAVLLGHSDGASIAAIYAGSVSDMRVRGLVLIAPHFFVEQQSLDAIRGTGAAFADEGLRERLARHHTEVDVAFGGWFGAWTDPDFMAWNIGDEIDHWRIPALAIQGDADPYGSLAQIDEIEARIYAPFERMIVSGAAHNPHDSARSKVTDRIADFCKTLWDLETLPSPISNTK